MIDAQTAKSIRKIFILNQDNKVMILCIILVPVSAIVYCFNFSQAIMFTKLQ